MIINFKYYFFIIMIITGIFSSCTKGEENYKPPNMVTEIVPSENENDFAEDIFSGNSYGSGSEKPLIDIGNDEVLISSLNLNLDLDSQEEQILVLKKRAEPNGKIKIAVADYDNVKNSYERAWESETGAEIIRSFVVHLDDLIGDHNNEIICSGRDSKGRTTLDVFWKNTSDNNQLGYTPVFNVAERGTIEINQQERSRAYHQGLKDGVSLTITITKESEDASAPPALIVTVYYWDFPLKKYTQLSQETIENTKVAEKQLGEIFSGSEDAFYDFIKGPWFNNDHIIYFDPAIGNATFYADEIQETYSWVNSYKVLSNLLYIRCRNEIITYIENEIYVKIVDLDKISITVRDIDSQTRTKGSNDIWTNEYTRMNTDMRTETVKSIFNVIDESHLPELSGQYISDAGDIIEFYGSNFYIKATNEELNGGFAVYSADMDILSLKIINDKGIVSEERTFAINYSEVQKDSSIERTLVLNPGILSIYGFHAYDTEFLRYTQVETLEFADEETQ